MRGPPTAPPDSAGLSLRIYRLPGWAEIRRGAQAKRSTDFSSTNQGWWGLALVITFLFLWFLNGPEVSVCMFICAMISAQQKPDESHYLSEFGDAWVHGWGLRTEISYYNTNTVIYIRLRLVRIRSRLVSQRVLRLRFDWWVLGITAYWYGYLWAARH